MLRIPPEARRGPWQNQVDRARNLDPVRRPWNARTGLTSARAARTGRRARIRASDTGMSESGRPSSSAARATRGSSDRCGPRTVRSAAPADRRP